ncbi:hypothetical protein ASE36_20750 [Rhizobium sp. Root274]|jgi:hypothetical protein|uniref:hypothetical protein n=1 Tax=unclassified Rhizobium TaxID=2613769 RepID=UPI000715D50F|nr:MULTISPECIES: hypothetical protein [unclassified Rhizobium]KQW26412.1 hypothetical protein ASC71_20800 [Rhizobium sp. Root1240]KRD26382.1 hypothetical protein ASE36_20750 [Rhizobium sp. Root274]
MTCFLRQWIERRRAIRRRWQEDARRLAATDPVNAYYEAQRRAARSRAQGLTNEYWHWARVASEVARIEPRAEMDFEVVKAIADQETTGRR